MQQSVVTSFGLNTTVPPPTDPQAIMQRGDEVNTIQRMLTDTQTSAVMLIGGAGVGKSTLAALLYNRLLLAKQSGLPAPQHMLWLSIGSYTTLPDIIAAILSGINAGDPGLFLQKPEQQLTTLWRALCRPEDNALIVMDQFELLLHPETSQGVAGRGVLPLFLSMLQADLGSSRILLTGYNFPYDENKEENRARSYLVSRISIPEGVALMQWLGVAASSEELSLVWQRCSGHVFALVLVNALLQLSGISLSALLNSPDYQPLWSGDVTTHLLAGVYHYLNPVQYILVRTLSLFNEPVSLQGIITTITGSSAIGSDSASRPYTIFERELNTLMNMYIAQPTRNRAGDLAYTLPSSLRQYVLEHYLEGNERRQSEELASLGVDLPLNPAPSGPEAERIAMAAGHMQVAGYYQHLASERCPPRHLRKGLQDIEPLVSTVRHLCLGWRWQQACDLLFEESLHENMVQWGAWNTLIGLYTAMLPPFGNLSERDEGLVRSHVAMLYGRLGEYQQSQAYFEQALALQRKVKDVHGEATTLANQGELLRGRGEYDVARTSFEQVLALAQRINDVPMQCVMLHNLGLLYHGLKDYKQAFSYYLEALRLGYNLPERQNQGTILTNMGMLLYQEGLQKESLAVLLAALKLRLELQDPTVVLLEKFLRALEQKMGTEAYKQLCQSALSIQKQVFSRFMSADMRQ